MAIDKDGSNRLLLGGIIAIIAPDSSFPWWLTIGCAVVGTALLLWGGYTMLRHYRK